MGRDVIPPKDERAGIATTSDRPDGWGERSGGENPRKASTARPPSWWSGDSTDSSREQGPVGGHVIRPPLFREGRRGGGQRQEGRDPERGTHRDAGNALEGEAHGRSGALRAGRIGGGRGREGGSQTSHVARGGGGTRCHSSDSAGPGLCRRARKPRRGCIAGRVGLPASAGAHDAAARGCWGMSLKRRRSAGGVAVRLRPGGRLGRRTPEGRRNAARVGREPVSVLAFQVRNPRSTTKPHERPRESPRGGLSNPSSPHTSEGR